MEDTEEEEEEEFEALLDDDSFGCDFRPDTLEDDEEDGGEAFDWILEGTG